MLLFDFEIGSSYYAEILGRQLADQLDRDLRSPSAETISRITSIALSHGKAPPLAALTYEAAAREYLEALAVTPAGIVSRDVVITRDG